jgi:metal-sulfur cluster biosynthetic enzyme
MAMASELEILQALRGVNDPEVGVNIVDLGLVYSTEIVGDKVRSLMTITTPACPMHSYLTEEVRNAILSQHEEVEDVNVELVWDPRWSPQMISEKGKRQLGWT